MNALKLPSAVRVLGEWTKIKFVDSIHEADGPCHGLYIQEKALILIENNESREFMYQVLIHEITHAYLRISGLDEILGHNAEEAICRLIENFKRLFKLSLDSKDIKWTQPRSDEKTGQNMVAKKRVYNKLQYALRSGKLKRPTNCESCLKRCKPQGHHPDYDKPLEVIWLCQDCHHNEHTKGE